VKAAAADDGDSQWLRWARTCWKRGTESLDPQNCSRPFWNCSVTNSCRGMQFCGLLCGGIRSQLSICVVSYALELLVQVVVRTW